MIAALIRWSIGNRFLVLLVTLMLSAWGVYSLLRTPLDALPDLSDVQVIIRTTYPGQAPRIVENQITYPLTTTMLSVPGAKTVRGYSFFGDSFVYVLFDDGTDLYWARSRVLEYLNQCVAPAARSDCLASPDATGVGWIYQYSLIDRSGQMDAGQLRALQDWFLKYELKTVANVAEVASVGGMVRQYQILLDLTSWRFTASHTPRWSMRSASPTRKPAARSSNSAKPSTCARLGPPAVARRLPQGASGDHRRRRLGAAGRRGAHPGRPRDAACIGELDGEGEATGGVIVMRSGKNALETIAAVKAKLQQLQGSLPKGVEIVPVYDRSGLIERAVENLGFAA